MISEITIDGNLARDPQQHTFQNGGSVWSANIGHSQGYFDQSHQWQDQGTLWVDVQDRSAHSVLALLHKGDHILVSGMLTQYSYQGKDGQQHTALQVRARQIALIPRQQNNQQSGYQRPAQQPQQPQSQPQQGYMGAGGDAWGAQPNAGSTPAF